MDNRYVVEETVLHDSFFSRLRPGYVLKDLILNTNLMTSFEEKNLQKIAEEYNQIEDVYRDQIVKKFVEDK